MKVKNVTKHIIEKGNKEINGASFDSPDHRGQTVPTELFPSPAELLKMHKGTSTVSPCARRLGLKVSPFSCALSSGSKRVRERRRGKESGRIISSNLFFVNLVG